jgi:hypothetical protein
MAVASVRRDGGLFPRFGSGTAICSQIEKSQSEFTKYIRRCASGHSMRPDLCSTARSPKKVGASDENFSHAYSGRAHSTRRAYVIHVEKWRMTICTMRLLLSGRPNAYTRALRGVYQRVHRLIPSGCL